VLAPKFTPTSVCELSEPHQSFDLNSSPYTPGYVRLNNIKANDYLTSSSNYYHRFVYSPSGKGSELLKRFTALAKWNQRLFKSQVSPHEFLQEVVRVGRFQIRKQGDPTEFLGWLLNTQHKDLGGTKKRNSSVMYSTFQGELRLDTQQVITKDVLYPGISRPYDQRLTSIEVCPLTLPVFPMLTKSHRDQKYTIPVPVPCPRFTTTSTLSRRS
jgi:U4/U6.U5 tri-snRNP-associated protein 2